MKMHPCKFLQITVTIFRSNLNESFLLIGRQKTIGERILSTRWRRWDTTAVIWRRHSRGCWGCAAWDGLADRSTCRRGCRWRYTGNLSGRTRIWSVAWEMTATCIRVRTLRIDIAARRRRQSRRGPSRGWLQAYREACLHHTASCRMRTRRAPSARSLSSISSLPASRKTHTSVETPQLGPVFLFKTFFDEEKARTKRVDDTESSSLQRKTVQKAAR